jgi:hypothetical protein
VFQNLKTLSIAIPWGDLASQEGTTSQLIKKREPYWISKWTEKRYQRLLAAFDDTLVDVILDEKASVCENLGHRHYLVSCKLFLLQFNNMRIFQKKKICFG